MSLSTSRSGIFIGRNHGFAVTRPEKMSWKTRPVTRKGLVSKRNKNIKELIREITGLSPLESKMEELLKAGDSAKDKKATKLARHKLGTHRRAILKREELQKLIQAQRKKN